MSLVKVKSNDNIRASKFLIDNRIYSPSVHCSYYSVYLLSMYALFHGCGINYQEQKKKSKGIDSHYYVMMNVADDLGLKNRFYKSDFLTWYSKLKKMRKKADYSDQLITDKEANKSYDWANKIIDLLTKQYSI